MMGDIQARLERAIEAARAGEKKRARDNLIHVIELDERNEQAWMWLSTVVDALGDKIICLENVLEINPANDQAAADLARLRRQPPDKLPVSLPRLTGGQAAAPRACPRCGARNPGWAYVCDRCGASLKRVDVQEALGVVTWERTLATWGAAIVAFPVWRLLARLGLWLATGWGGPGEQLIAALYCALGALLPGVALALLNIPVALLTWLGIRVVGNGRAGAHFGKHFQLTTMAMSAWAIVMTFLAAFTPLAVYLAGGGRNSAAFSRGALIFAGLVIGLTGVVSLAQAIRAAHRVGAARAALALLIAGAPAIAILLALYLATPDGFATLMGMVAALFQLCLS